MPGGLQGLIGNRFLTAYTPGMGNRRIEGGRQTATGAPMYTFEQYKAGKAPYITGAVAGRPTGQTVYTRLPGAGTAPIKLTDTGGGLRRNQIDLASSNPSYATNFPLQGRRPIYDNPFGLISGGIDIYGDSPSPSGFQTQGPYLPGQFQQAFQRGTYNAFTDPTTDTAATPPPSAPTPAPTLTPYDPMGYGADTSTIGMNIPPNEDVSPNIVNTFLGGQDYNSSSPGLAGVSRQKLLPTPPGGWPRAVAADPNFYPVPGLGQITPYGATSDWRQNATWGGGSSGLNLWNSGGFTRGALGALGSLFSGGTPISNIPEYSGFAGPVGRSSAGPLQP